jgi:hypothetical protein
MLARRVIHTLDKLIGRLALYVGLALALGIVVASACTAPQAERPPTSVRPSPTATRTAAQPPTTLPSATSSVTPTATPTGIPATSPGSSPASACPRSSGGTTGAQAQLVAIRIAHQPGYDRLVFEFGRSAAPGPFAIPAYSVEPTSSLVGASGQAVTVAGSALFGLRFQNASTRNVDGTSSYTGSTDLRPTTPLIKEVRLVEDFERVLVWGAGLDHLVCPKVSTLDSPFRVVLDFPALP